MTEQQTKDLVARLCQITDAYLDSFPAIEAQEVCALTADEIGRLRKLVIEAHAGDGLGDPCECDVCMLPMEQDG